VHRAGPGDQVALIGAGVTLHECLAAADLLAEDHYPEGGIGSAVLVALTDARVPALQVVHLAVKDPPTSGTPAELLDAAGISSSHIVAAAERLTRR
jgi:transketolase